MIVHIIYALAYGGAETMLIDIINEQVKTQKVCLLLINNDSDPFLVSKCDKRVKIVDVNRNPGSRSILPILRFNWLLHQLKPTFVHCHDQNIISLIVFRQRLRVFVTVHAMNLPSDQLYKYDKVFSITEAVKQDVLKRCSIDSQVVYNGINTIAIKTKEAVDSVNVLKLLQVSRLDHLKKGHHILLKALKRVVDECPDVSIDLTFIGTGQSEKFLVDLTSSLGLDGKVTFLGLRTREFIYENICNYDLLVQPSLIEGFGLTIAEAMAAKVPVLVSDADGPIEIINHGEFGYFFERNNVDDLADKIKWFVQNHYSKLISEKVDKAYSHVVSQFDISLTAHCYLDAYRDV